jgi:hypothetical protein
MNQCSTIIEVASPTTGWPPPYKLQCVREAGHEGECHFPATRHPAPEGAPYTGFKGGSYKPFDYPLPPELADKIGDEKPTIHLITGADGQCLCGVYGEKTFICGDEINEKVASLERQLAAARAEVEILRVAFGVQPNETIPPQTPQFNSLLVDHAGSRRRISIAPENPAQVACELPSPTTACNPAQIRPLRPLCPMPGAAPAAPAAVTHP